MTSLKYVAASLTLACALLPAVARADDDVAALRAELEALKSDYASRLAALEARIEELGTAAPTAEPASTASAFNPAISVILTGNYTSLSQDPESWTIAGFLPSGGEVGPGERSFNLAESELVL